MELNSYFVISRAARQIQDKCRHPTHKDSYGEACGWATYPYGFAVGIHRGYNC